MLRSVHSKLFIHDKVMYRLNLSLNRLNSCRDQRENRKNNEGILTDPNDRRHKYIILHWQTAGNVHL